MDTNKILIILNYIHYLFIIIGLFFILKPFVKKWLIKYKYSREPFDVKLNGMTYRIDPKSKLYIVEQMEIQEEKLKEKITNISE